MKITSKLLYSFALMFGCVATPNLYCDNQTPDLSPIHSGEHLPFKIQLALADFQLPNGIHSFASGVYKKKWIFLAGRTNGLHGFAPTNNFPPSKQNTVVYVVDPINKVVYTKDLLDPTSGLTQAQVDTLSVTSPQSNQTRKTLYICGGYGVDTATGQFSTKSTLTAIDMAGLIHWVVSPSPGETAAQYIRQISDPVFQITGGYLGKVTDEKYLLIFGQNFTGQYTDGSNGVYSEQVRKFKIADDGTNLAVHSISYIPQNPDPNYRRRDLNVVPVLKKALGAAFPAFVAFSGVFTESSGAWTIPVNISINGKSFMPPATDPQAFKQGMNNYICATLGLFSKKSNDMYIAFFGGISYGYYKDGIFTTDSELPFINQCTAIKLNTQGHYNQYLLDTEYPVVLSPNLIPLRFGAGAQFMPLPNVPQYSDETIKLDKLDDKPVLVGYIIGGIQSIVGNTEDPSVETAASPYIFQVIVDKK